MVNSAKPVDGAARSAVNDGFRKKLNPSLQPERSEECVMAHAKWTSSGLAAIAAMLLAASIAPARGQTPPKVTVFEGARVITGDGSTPIENAAIVVTGDRITAIGRRGEV